MSKSRLVVIGAGIVLGSFPTLAQPAQGHAAGASPPTATRSRVADPVAAFGPATVLSTLRMNGAETGLPDGLDLQDGFGSSATSLGDFDGDGDLDMAVGAQRDDDGQLNHGAVWLLFLEPDGSLERAQKISSTDGGFTGDVEGGHFGSGLAFLGDVDGDGVGDLAVGASDDIGVGAVWVLLLNADGTVKASQEIVQLIGGFGTSVAALGDLDGDGTVDLVVGAPLDAVNGFVTGALSVVFLNPDGTMKAAQKINGTEGGFAGDLGANDHFGMSVAGLGDLDGDGVGDLAAGSPSDNLFAGAAWVLFMNPDGTVKAEQRLDSGHGGLTGVTGEFGTSIANAGDVDGDGVTDLAVGAPADTAGGHDAGAFWVLLLEPDGTVSDFAVHRAPSLGGDLEAEDLLGSAVAGLGDVDGDGVADLVVGAPGADQRGAVWVSLLGSNAGVDSFRKIDDGPDGLAGTTDRLDRFGTSVTALGDLDGDGVGDLAVGAPLDDDGVQDGGAVWILFQNANGTAKELRKITGAEGLAGALEAGDQLGTSLATLGHPDDDGIVELAVGATHDDDGAMDAGAVWILSVDASGAVVASQKISATQGGFPGVLHAGDAFGSALAAPGDLDGDGVRDLAVGAVGDDDGGQGTGAVWVLLLHADGTVKAAQEIGAVALGGALAPGDEFGSSLAALGDLDGDGAKDLAVGAARDDGNGPAVANRGSVHVLFLDPSGGVLGHQAISDVEGGFGGALDNQDLFGSSVAALGDVDGDGVVDLAVGATGDDDGAERAGAVWALFLRADGTVRAQQKISAFAGGLGASPTPTDLFGSAAALLGDVNGDGAADLAVGAPGDDRGGTDHGALWRLTLDGIATVDFESRDDLLTPLVNGQDLSSPPELGRSLALASSGANLGPAVFDSTPLGPNDPSQDLDLLVGRGNLLYLQNSVVPQQTLPGIFDRPNDDQDGGTFSLTFLHGGVAPLSVVLVDIDLGGNQMARVTLSDTAGRTRVYAVPGGWTGDLVADGTPGFRTLDLATLAPQPGFAASATASESPGFDGTRVIRLEVVLGSSGAVDDLRWDPYP